MAEPTPPPEAPSRDAALRLHETMVLIRAFDQRVANLVLKGAFSGVGHLYVGQEAVAAGVCAALRDDDYMTSNHRGHGHCLAKGVDPNEMMAELFGRTGGTSRGKGGSMHIADFRRGMLGANGIVGAGLPIACGAALTAKTTKSGRIAVSFFGDGASNIGMFHEALNLASVWKLPVVFVCENNRYGEATPVEYALSVEHVVDRAASYNMPGLRADGQDVLDVLAKARWAVEHARSGAGPVLLECDTYRYFGHFVGDPARYRSADEVEWYRARDCIVRFGEYLAKEHGVTQKQLDAIAEAAERRMDEAVAFAEASPVPDVSEITSGVYGEVPA
ncbi:MAG: thiamine pyrophosphate-dependent dehydrogenase E1 component subunit alpha [Dehalococcoidia bacterium]|nr:MAG: thiamine pyrophosphate-dependent dehydrogenase E1 component subunit alpha [Dehalococcoidia bacterium]